jgi:hypothetical protein
MSDLPNPAPPVVRHEFSSPDGLFPPLAKGVHVRLSLHCYLPLNIRDSSVSTTMGYGMDGWGSISGRGKIIVFSIASKSTLGPTQPPIQWASRGKAAGA